jgi:enoyl-CoA hydratase/3-hydroxyacyl-CoA dehydrogenase
MHFFNPAVVTKLVEVIKGDETSEETMQLTPDLATRMNKLPVRVEKDSVGFICNKIGASSLILLGALVDKRIAASEEIDARLKQMRAPMGPFELMDDVELVVLTNDTL